jgi:hypothetical protein
MQGQVKMGVVCEWWIRSATAAVAAFAPLRFQSCCGLAGVCKVHRNCTRLCQSTPRRTCFSSSTFEPNHERMKVALCPDNLSASVSSLEKRFRVGDYYVWLYRDVSGLPTSWERYCVTKKGINDYSIVIEVRFALQIHLPVSILKFA